LAGSGGNNPPEDVLTMQCIIQFLYTDLDSIPMVCSLYEQMYITSVLDVYDALYEDKKELGLFWLSKSTCHRNSIKSDILPGVHAGEDVTCLGFDSYLREDYQSKLIQTANMPINQVDVGVHSANNYHDRIGDEKVYSCKYSRYVPLSDITV